MANKKAKFLDYSSKSPCYRCKGTGKEDKQKCTTCGGTGKWTEQRYCLVVETAEGQIGFDVDSPGK